MDQNATWYAGRSRPYSHIVLDGDPAPLQRGNPHNDCGGETAGWMKMPLDRDVDLGSGETLLGVDPAPQRSTAPNFWPMCVVTKRLDGSRCLWYGGRPRPMAALVLDWDPAPSGRVTAASSSTMSIVAKRSSISAAAEHLFSKLQQL